MPIAPFRSSASFLRCHAHRTVATGHATLGANRTEPGCQAHRSQGANRTVHGQGPYIFSSVRTPQVVKRHDSAGVTRTDKWSQAVKQNWGPDWAAEHTMASSEGRSSGSTNAMRWPKPTGEGYKGAGRKAEKEPARRHTIARLSHSCLLRHSERRAATYTNRCTTGYKFV